MEITVNLENINNGKVGTVRAIQPLVKRNNYIHIKTVTVQYGIFSQVRQSLEALSALLAGQNSNAVPPTKLDSTEKSEPVTVNSAAGNS